jgi:hypothetical protein
MSVTKKKLESIPTIDVSLVVIRVGSETDGTEYAVDTASQIAVEVQTETTDAIKLVKAGKLLAQKPQTTTITGNQITLTDNVFSPTLAKILQGGTITSEGDTFIYAPPAAGSSEKGSVFTLDAYSAQYDASGQIVQYEKISYPNCQGTPFGVGAQDDTFRVPEYTINSAPKTGESPYKISYVKILPDFSKAVAQQIESVTSEETRFGRN